MDAWNWKVYPSTKFASEYGFQSFPSLKSLSKIANTSDLRFPLSDAIKQRQHHRNGNNEIINLIDTNMNLPIAGGVDSFQDFIYLSQISQAMSLKIETEFYRRNRAIDSQTGEGLTMGALYWQLNDIWPAPTWASIEFGGKWKMSHYFIKKVFEPLLVVAFEENDRLKVALIRDDYFGNINFEVRIRVFKWSSLNPTFEINLTQNTPSLSSKLVYDESVSNVLASGKCLNRSECVIEVNAENLDRNLRSNNFLLLTSLREAIGMTKTKLTVTRITGAHNFMPKYVYNIEIKTNSISLFVWLDFSLDSEIVGEFSENGFLMFNETKSIYFFSETPVEVNQLKSELTVRSLTDVKTQ